MTTPTPRSDVLSSSTLDLPRGIGRTLVRVLKNFSRTIEYFLRTFFRRTVRAGTVKAVQSFFRIFGVQLLRISETENHKLSATALFDLRFVVRLIEYLPTKNLDSLLSESRSQLRQDLFVLAMLGFPRNRYFVEFGATDGVDLSNSYLPEKQFGWKGILAEPARMWHKDLSRNRSCKIDQRAVWSESGQQLEFNETVAGALSTLDRFSSSDSHAQFRASGRLYPVSTVSLSELLNFHSAPSVIDYLSMDTEGSELEILRAFDFSEYSFKVITVEHNFTSARGAIKEVLEKNGYVRVLDELSNFDDWYLNKDHFENSLLLALLESPKG